MKITSFDGTVIDCGVTGSGPPLLIVSGTGDDQRRFNRVKEPLGAHFTVHVMDRRGRGESGDTEDFEVAYDVRDIIAILGQFDHPVHVLAHSYGARCAMEAALEVDNIAKLLLYEPPIPNAFEDTRRQVVERIAALGEVDDRKGIVVTYLRDFFSTPDAVIENQMAKPDTWAKWMQMAHTIPRELVCLRREVFVDEKFADFTVPTRILTGGDSTPNLLAAAERVRAAIPNADIVELPGQGHIAMTTAPKLFADEALRFLRD
jgi:pimeloyl-ACP methyl ester carboxylesterase